MKTIKVPLRDGEAAFIKPAEVQEPSSACEAHDLPTAGLAQWIIKMARKRHGKGGLNVCTSCLERAKSSLKR